MDINTQKNITELLYNLATDSAVFRGFMYHSCENNWHEVENWINNSDYATDFCVRSGATKGVLVLLDYHYVLKFPYLSQYSDEETREDYCKLEWRNYLLAKDAELDECFAETGFLNNICFDDVFGNTYEFPVYYQEQVNCCEDEIDNEFYEAAYAEYCEEGDDCGWDGEPFESDEDKRDYFWDVFYDMDNESRYSSYLAAQFGSKYEDFCEFCYENNINDLHSGNFGFNRGSIVVTDFSGYGNHNIFSTKGWDSRCFVA